MHHEFTMDQFCDWLCNHEAEIVGEGGRCFSSPLAAWLSDLCHATVGVEDARYGRASLPWWQWNLLPKWAVSFSLRLERCSFQPLTGWDALAVLADVELAV